jgi:hypothetical protein
MNPEIPETQRPDPQDRLGDLEKQFKELFAKQARARRAVPETQLDSAQRETQQATGVSGVGVSK